MCTDITYFFREPHPWQWVTKYIDSGRKFVTAPDDGRWVHTPAGHKKKGNKKMGQAMLECTVEEREAVYFPDGWWHLTLNLDESVFMSSFVNYAHDDRSGQYGTEL